MRSKGFTGRLIPWLATGSRWRTWLLAILLTLAVEGLALALFSAGDLELFSVTSVPVVMPVMLTGMVITSVALAGHACRRGFDAGRFLGRFLLWLVLCAFAAVITIAIILESLTHARVYDVFMFSISALILALIGLVSSAPFLVLARFGETYRERFRTALERG